MSIDKVISWPCHLTDDCLFSIAVSGSAIELKGCKRSEDDNTIDVLQQLLLNFDTLV
jgi:hypothetical protein